jgi:hypothetical protein
MSGLAALSLDALSSVAYGPEAMVLVLIAAGSGALRYTLPLTLVIIGMLVLLVLSYSQGSAVLVVGPSHANPVAQIGRALPIHATEAVGIVLILKAFAAGCSAVTGVEAIANGVPAFRRPRIRTAQRTEISLGALLGVMLVGLAILIRARHVVPRGGVTILAQLTAGAFGTGWPFYVSNLAVTLVLGLAANTSFGGLPVVVATIPFHVRS